MVGSGDVAPYLTGGAAIVEHAQILGPGPDTRALAATVELGVLFFRSRRSGQFAIAAQGILPVVTLSQRNAPIDLTEVAVLLRLLL